jgi:hypothetical protein
VKRFLRSFIRVLPRHFRERFGAEMLEQIEQEYDEARSASRVAGTWYALSTMGDLARSAVAEWWNHSWVPPHSASEKRRGMSSTLDDWTKDLRHSLRALRRTPGFTVMAVGTLGIAIGALAGMFSVVNTVLLKPLPYAHADRLIVIAASAPGSDFPEQFGVSNEFFVQYRGQRLSRMYRRQLGTSTLRV